MSLAAALAAIVLAALWGAAACDEDPLGPDGGATDAGGTTDGAGGGDGATDGAAEQGTSSDGTQLTIPDGGVVSSAFKRAWWEKIGDLSGAKGVPLLGQFDNDGRPDLAVDLRTVDYYYYPSDPQSIFGAQTTLPVNGIAGGWGGAVADLDGDSHLDLVFGDHVDGLRVLLGDGNGAFVESSPADPTPNKMTFSGAGVGDVNGDGKPDILAGSDQFFLGVVLWLGDGNGGWTETATTGLPAFVPDPPSGFMNIGHLILVDADTDGDLDLFAFGQVLGVGEKQGGVTCRVYLNGGSGTAWTEITGKKLEGGNIEGVGAPVQGDVADIDGDGQLDLACGGEIFLGQGTSFTWAASVDASQISQLADMNNDGRLDLVTHYPHSGLNIFLGDGSGKGWTEDKLALLPGKQTMPPGASATELYNAYGIAIADLDKNGNLDIVRNFSAKKSGGYEGYLEAWTR